jgi:hypothetical protein
MYTAPAGRTAIVKDLRICNVTGAGTSTILAVHSGAHFCNLFIGTLGASSVAVLSPAFIVLEPGDELLVNAQAANSVTWYVSGAELDGVAP